MMEGGHSNRVEVVVVVEVSVEVFVEVTVAVELDWCKWNLKLDLPQLMLHLILQVLIILQLN